MTNYDRLDDKNFILYAAKNYDNPQCHDIAEFNEDIRRIKYIKKSITRYQTTGILKERQILNHIIILNNVFGPEPLIRMLFLKMEKQMKFVKPFLILLSILPPMVYNIGKDGKIFHTEDIPMEPAIVDVLRKIDRGER